MGCGLPALPGQGQCSKTKLKGMQYSRKEREEGGRERKLRKEGRKKDRTNLECRTRISIAGSPEGPCES